MTTFKRSVPSLGTLAVFEAAARLGGFTKAANELGVTQAAVSRQIRTLEDDLNTPLFVRAHRKIQLTRAGRVLAEAVGQSFERISDAIEVVRNPTPADTLIVSTTLAFSHFWLLPRLPSFRNEHPELELRVISQDVPVDLRDGGVDVLLRFGKSPFRDGTALVSHPETAYPVCSPDFADGLPEDFDIARLCELPLIEIDPEEPSWLTWRQWFTMAGLKRPSRRSGLRFNHYSDAVYAAINGEGVTLGWHNLLERPLADGRLVRLGDVSVTPGDGHHVVVPDHVRDEPAVEAFVAWIEAAFASDL
ncbi:LysR substrate-binding domain-containing protein [Acuticoccus sp. M5D2P5]|uniref:LysR substrate-binding domain-containing protein n=1 Tax=Acuticoccus kalidii TaxID=2910977 RepID=UPI001F178BC4|nr:LysR substrate-binding domain-containing protein [Acuticoccus kalidii]MCF3932343.1 LysR substrate-binding domain-containing protein [Acuticoccus kalidii]